MQKYLIRREIPGAGNMSSDELRAASQESCSAAGELGPNLQWVQSYISEDKVHCVFLADTPAQIREHAERAGIPADEIMKIKAITDPATAEA